MVKIPRMLQDGHKLVTDYSTELNNC